MPRKPRPVSRTERAVSFTILVILAGMAVWVYTKQFAANPALLAELEFKKMADPSQTTPTEARSQSKTGVGLLPHPSGLTAISLPEVFNPDNLSDKINGKAELYLTSGFKELKTQRFSSGGSENWLEIFIYDMGTSRHAFAVFSGQRRTEAENISITTLAYRTANAIFLAKSRYYIEIVAAQANPELQAAGLEAARALVAGMGGPSENLEEASLFPAVGLQAGRLRLTVANVFGFEGLTEVFTADYHLPEGEATAFLSQRATPFDAEKLAGDYVNFILANGGREVKTERGRPDMRFFNVAEAYEAIFTRGSFLAGVHEAENISVAAELAEQLAVNLERAKP